MTPLDLDAIEAHVGSQPYSVVLSLVDRVRQLKLEVSAGRAMAMIEPKDMPYSDRSEFDRLKHADVAQGKRIAALLAEVQELEIALFDWQTSDSVAHMRLAEASSRIRELSAALIEACDIITMSLNHLDRNVEAKANRVLHLRAVAIDNKSEEGT